MDYWDEIDSAIDEAKQVLSGSPTSGEQMLARALLSLGEHLQAHEDLLSMIAKKVGVTDAEIEDHFKPLIKDRGGPILEGFRQDRIEPVKKMAGLAP